MYRALVRAQCMPQLCKQLVCKPKGPPAARVARQQSLQAERELRQRGGHDARDLAQVHDVGVAHGVDGAAALLLLIEQR